MQGSQPPSAASPARRLREDGPPGGRSGAVPPAQVWFWLYKGLFVHVHGQSVLLPVMAGDMCSAGEEEYFAEFSVLE